MHIDHIEQLMEGIKNGDIKAVNSYAFYVEDEWDMTESIKYYKMEIDCEYAETMQNYAGILYKEIGVDRNITKRQVMAQHLLI